MIRQTGIWENSSGRGGQITLNELFDAARVLINMLPGTENDDDAVTLDEDEDGGIGRHLDGVIAAVRASSAR
jgi:hypothetical protein